MRAAALFCLAFFTTAIPAAAFPAHVARCHDGDTCTTDTGVRIRLAEIDQPYKLQARDLLCSMICGRDVDIEPRGTSYDRTVGLIRVGGVDTSEAMVADGAAWDYERYDRDPVMPALEEKAREGRLGLWANAGAIPPWTWRHSRAGRFTPPR